MRFNDIPLNQFNQLEDIQKQFYSLEFKHYKDWRPDTLVFELYKRCCKCKDPLESWYIEVKQKYYNLDELVIKFNKTKHTEPTFEYLCYCML